MSLPVIERNVLTIMIMAEVERYPAAEDLPQGRLEIIILQTKEFSRPEKGRQYTI